MKKSNNNGENNNNKDINEPVQDPEDELYSFVQNCTSGQTVPQGSIVYLESFLELATPQSTTATKTSINSIGLTNLLFQETPDKNLNLSNFDFTPDVAQIPVNDLAQYLGASAFESIIVDQNAPENIRQAIKNSGKNPSAINFVNSTPNNAIPPSINFSQIYEDISLAIVLRDLEKTKTNLSALSEAEYLRWVCFIPQGQASLITIAINEGAVEIAQFLIGKIPYHWNKIAFPDCPQDKIEATLIAIFESAVSKRNLPIVQDLLTLGLHRITADYFKPVIDAVCMGGEDIVTALLNAEFSAEEGYESDVNEECISALKEAVKLKENALAMTKLLIMHGAKVSQAVIDHVVEYGSKKEAYSIINYFDQLDATYWLSENKLTISFENRLAAAKDNVDALRELRNLYRNDPNALQRINSEFTVQKRKDKRKVDDNEEEIEEKTADDEIEPPLKEIKAEKVNDDNEHNEEREGEEKKRPLKKRKLSLGQAEASKQTDAEETKVQLTAARCILFSKKPFSSLIPLLPLSYQELINLLLNSDFTQTPIVDLSENDLSNITPLQWQEVLELEVSFQEIKFNQTVPKQIQLECREFFLNNNIRLTNSSPEKDSNQSVPSSPSYITDPPGPKLNKEEIIDCLLNAWGNDYLKQHDLSDISQKDWDDLEEIFPGCSSGFRKPNDVATELYEPGYPDSKSQF